MRLVSVDRSSYRFGDPIIYEVELTNKGTAAFAVPTSLDQRAFEHLDAGPTTLSVVLEAMVGDKRESIAAIRMVGAPSEPGSMQMLVPGERMLVTIPAEVFSQPSLAKTHREYPVRARIAVDEGERRFQESVSPNMLQVTMQLSRGR